MAKSANSKVVFVPMQLQSDVSTQLANQASGSGSFGAMLQNEAGGDVLGSASRVGVMNSVADI